jgi:hypothetical protein
MISTPVNFSNLLPGSLDWEHYNKKNHEAHSPTNQILNDEIEEKINYTKGSKTKNSN